MSTLAQRRGWRIVPVTVDISDNGRQQGAVIVNFDLRTCFGGAFQFRFAVVSDVAVIERALIHGLVIRHGGDDGRSRGGNIRSHRGSWLTLVIAAVRCGNFYCFAVHF